ncbi:MAG: putative ABC transporter permease subunit [bacterium]
MTLRRLLWYRVEIFLSAIRHGKSRTRAATLLLPIVVAVGLGGVYLAFHTLFEILGEVGQSGIEFGSALIVAMLHAIFFIALTIDVGTTMNIFFLSTDLTLLLASPLSTTKVFLLKYIDALGSSSLLSIVLGLPIAFAFGKAVSAPLIYYPCILFVILLLLSIPVSIGTIIGLLISRFVSPRRTKEVLALVGSLFGLGIWLGIQLLRSKIAASTPQEISGYSQLLSRSLTSPIMGALPSTYAARTLISFSISDWSNGILYLSVLLALSFAILVGSIQIAKKAYLTGWTRTSSATQTKIRKRADHLPDFFFLLPRFERAIARTTLRAYIRDPQQISQFFTLAIMLFVIAILPSITSGKGIGSEVRSVTGVAYIAFICGLNLAMTLMVIDGKSFWLIMASPVSAARKVISKIVASLFFLIPIILVFLVILGVSKQITHRTLALMTPAVIALSIAGTSVGSALGLHYAKWDWDNPKRMHKIGGRMVMMVLIFLFFAISTIVMRYIGEGQVKEKFLNVIVTVTIPVAAIFTLVSVWVCARKLRRMDWQV